MDAGPRYAADAVVTGLYVHPIKSLSPERVDTVTLGSDGGPVRDRRYVLVDDHGNQVKAVNEGALVGIDADYTFDGDELESVELSAAADSAPESGKYAFPEERHRVATWVEDYLGTSVHLEEQQKESLVGNSPGKGPALISRGTLEALSEPFAFGPDNLRERLRPNIVVDGVDAGWEDFLYPPDREAADQGSVSISGTKLYAVEPCERCAVPARDTATAEISGPNYDNYQDFTESFASAREEMYPEAATNPLDTWYHAMVLTETPATSIGNPISTDDIAWRPV